MRCLNQRPNLQSIQNLHSNVCTGVHYVICHSVTNCKVLFICLVHLMWLFIPHQYRVPEENNWSEDSSGGVGFMLHR